MTITRGILHNQTGDFQEVLQGERCYLPREGIHWSIIARRENAVASFGYLQHI